MCEPIYDTKHKKYRYIPKSARTNGKYIGDKITPERARKIKTKSTEPIQAIDTTQEYHVRL